MSNVALIAGLGPGFCEEFAWKLAYEGYSIGAFARSEDYLDDFEGQLRDSGFEACGVPTGITDPEAVTAGIDRVRSELSDIEVLAHTASTVTDASREALDPDRFEKLWRLYAYGGLLSFREAKTDLIETGGTALFFGASPQAGDFAYKSGKDAARGLARSLAERYGPRGIHVAHVVVDGSILNPDVYEANEEVDEENHIDPTAAADTCYHLVVQPDRGRTFELDLHANERTTVQ